MKRSLKLVCVSLFLASALMAQTNDSVYFKMLKYSDRVEVYVDSMLFTAYRYESTLEKPVLFPINAPDGTQVTRGYPLQPGKKERVDHPHHVGLWFNFGDVNGFDFWNNSSAISADRKGAFGRIIHRSVEIADYRGTSGVLKVKMDWMAPDNDLAEKLIEESTTYVFHALDGIWIVDRITSLKAVAEKVIFTDNKEGMLAIRVDRAFEHTSQSPVILSDKKGQPSDEAVVDNEGVTGWYTNSEGDEGLDAWGKNAKWVRLTGTKAGTEYTLVLMDHPQNINYPACWHARGYGLFSVNNLGRNVYNRKLDKFQLVLNKGESLSFSHRFVVANGRLSIDEVEVLYLDFTGE